MSLQHQQLAEVASGLRITHALSNSSNKLIFMFSSTDMYTDGCNGQVAVGSTSDVTTSLIGNQMMLVKRNAYDGDGTVEVDTKTGIAEYAPGSTSSVTYTPIFIEHQLQVELFMSIIQLQYQE